MIGLVIGEVVDVEKEDMYRSALKEARDHMALPRHEFRHELMATTKLHEVWAGEELPRAIEARSKRFCDQVLNMFKTGDERPILGQLLPFEMGGVSSREVSRRSSVGQIYVVLCHKEVLSLWFCSYSCTMRRSQTLRCSKNYWDRATSSTRCGTWTSEDWC